MRETKMRLDAWLLVGCVALVSETALAGNFSSSLKNFYAEYEVVKQCQQETQLSVADTELAKGAIAKIEAYYMKRDTSIDKERLLKQAVSDKNDGFRIATRNRNSDLRSFCQVSLKELLEKAEEVEASTKSQ
jgi:hypothetical protein